MEADLDGLDAEEGVAFVDGDPDLERSGVFGGVTEPREAMDVDAVAGQGGAGAGAGGAFHGAAWGQDDLGRVGDDCLQEQEQEEVGLERPALGDEE